MKLLTSNHTPTVEAADQTLARGQMVAAASLFTATDEDGVATIIQYELIDATAAGGQWFVEDARMAPGAHTILVSASQLRKVSFLTAQSGGDTLIIRAFDGIAWSEAKSFTINTINHAPTISGLDHAFPHDTAVGLGSLIAVADNDGVSDLASFTLTDGNADPTSGYWIVDGQKHQGGKVTVDAAKLADVFWKGGSTVEASIDPVSVTVVDIMGASATINLTYATLANHAPVVEATDGQTQVSGSIRLMDLIKVTDADADTIKYYGVDWYDDGLRNVKLMHNGAVYDGYKDFTPAEFAEVRLVGVAGGGVDGVSVRAQDAKGEWSAASWAHVTVI